MQFFNNMKFIKDSITKAANNVANNITIINEEQANLDKINTEVETLNSEINAACSRIGRRFLEYVVETNEMPGIDISDILLVLDPKMKRKEELEKEVIEIQKRLKNQMIVQEKTMAEEDFRKEKLKLDKALAMDVLSNEEYNEKLNSARKKLDNFEQIKKIEQQCVLGIITEEERDRKINLLI